LEHFAVKLTRRSLISATAGTLAAPVIGTLGNSPFVRFAEAAEPAWKHGLSLFGDVKYPPDFKHFDYVNPTAPKGGLVRQVGIGTFDNFNQVVSGVKGSLAMGLDLVIETLTTPALDEVSSEYGLLAELVSYPPDRASVTYRLRRNARWHDGKPVTPADVVWSFDVWTKNSPQLANYYRHVSKAE
jgi:microcin C transport system substrate-binding protein